MAHPQHAIPVVLADGEIRPVERAPAVERMSWALYDFANTIFSMNVATLYFAVWLVSDLGVSNTMDAVANGDRVGARRARRFRFSARSPMRAVGGSRGSSGFTVLSCVALARDGVPRTDGCCRSPVQAVDCAGDAPGGMACERPAACSGCWRRSSSRCSRIRRRSRSTTR